ncbi:hypothetical protein STEG23_001362 [Scotinomys teguina]
MIVTISSNLEKAFGGYTKLSCGPPTFCCFVHIGFGTKCKALTHSLYTDPLSFDIGSVLFLPENVNQVSAN